MQSKKILSELNEIQKLRLEILEMKHEKEKAVGASFTAPDTKVLIVDDDMANLKICEGMLMPYGMQVTLCGSGLEAVAQVMAHHYDLVFMDHVMPEMDGLEATRHIREQKGTYIESLPIIALTANAISGVREMLIQNGMNDFLAKPIETAKLDEILVKWIPTEKKKRPVSTKTIQEESILLKMLRMIPELSVDKALSLVGGSMEAYERTVKTSVNLLPDNTKRLNELIHNDLSNYMIMAHGIKGVLNNIGAYELGEKAAKLEKISKRGAYDSCTVWHGIFIDKLIKFTDSVMTILRDTEELVKKTDRTMVLIANVIPKLTEAADTCEMTLALEILSDAATYAYGESIDIIITKLLSAFESFDFDKAKELIKELKYEAYKHE